MAEGISFINGTKPIELSIGLMNETLVFPEDENFSKKYKNHTSFLNTLVKDVTSFESQVHKTTREMYEKSTSRILDYLLSEESTISTFQSYSKARLLKTALVQCNFTDISRLVEDVRKAIKDEHRGSEMIVINEDEQVHTIIEKLALCRSRCVIVIQQFESLKQDMLDYLIKLIYSKSTLVKKLSDVRLIIGICTSAFTFTSTCLMETTNKLAVKEFTFSNAEQLFYKIIGVNIAPAVYSGRFLSYLKDRFLVCDYSVAAVVKAVQFAFLQKYVDDPFWKQRSASHSDDVEAYNRIFCLFCSVLKVDHRRSEMHLKVQTEPDFWVHIQDEPFFKDWVRRVFNAEGVEQLEHTLDVIVEKVGSTDEDWCAGLEYLRRRMRLSMQGDKNSDPAHLDESTSTPAKEKGTNFNMFRQKQREMMLAKLNNPLKDAINCISQVILDHFKTYLKPWPKDWPNVVDCETSLLDANLEEHVEHTMLVAKTFSKDPTAVAWRSLLSQKSWKSVHISEWAKSFVEETEEKMDEKSAFFAAVGHLEHMGLVRPNASGVASTVSILYHPVIHTSTN